MPAIIEHLEGVVGGLDAPPILIGHSAGGVFMQILLDHGYGAAGVAINSAPTEGVRVVPLVSDQGDLPGAQEPGQPPQGRRLHPRPVALRVHQHVQRGGVAARSTSATRSRASGGIFWGSVLANLQPGHQDTWVDYHNDNRAPLLFISGSEDHLMPPTMQRSNAKHYKSDTVTEVKEYEGTAAPAAGRRRAGRRSPTTPSTWAPSTPGAVPASRPGDRSVRLTHVGGPTVLIEVGRLAAPDRPDVRPAGPPVPLRLGHLVAQARRPGDRARRPRADRRGPAQPRPPRRQPRRGRAARCCPSAGVVVTTVPGAERLGRQRARARAVGVDAARGRRAAGDRGHRHPVPARPAAEPPARRRRDRLRATRGTARSTARSGSPATRCSTTACARSPTALSRRRRRCCTSAACASRSPGRCATR